MTMDVVVRYYLPLALPIIMTAVGLSLTVADLRQALARPRALVCGLIGQMVALPIIAFVLAASLPISGATAAGLVIIAASPGSPFSNYLTHVSRGDTMLSVVLTGASSLAGVLSMPVVVGWALGLFLGESSTVELPLGPAVVSLLGFTTLPILLGMAIRHFRPMPALRLRRLLDPLSGVLFAGVVIAAVYSERANIAGYLADAGAAAAALNVAAMALAYLATRWLRLPPPQRIAIMLEVGLQNATMAIFVAVSLLGRTELAIPAVAYGLVMLATSVIFAGLVRCGVTTRSAAPSCT